MRMNPGRITTLAAIAMCFAACDCDDETGFGDPCSGDTPPAFCSMACDADNPCPAGSYCGGGSMCTADCLPSGGCPAGQICAPDGRCTAAPRADGSVADGSVCANVSLVARPVTPNVVVIVDQSGSMRSNDFTPGVNRWDALRNVLLATPDGLIASLESQVRFGLALYSGEEGAAECPLMTEVGFALDNYAAIAATYNAAEPIAETPTGDAIDAVLDRVLNTPDPSPDPTIFIVATDGEPDRCEQFNPQRGQGEATAAVERAFNAGIRTFIISVGEGVVSDQHLQDMANSGLGRGATDPNAEFWVAGDEQGLTDALASIVGGVLNCDVFLEGRIDVSTACTGTVELNGRALTCNDPNGWQPVSENRIQILGTACEELQNESGAILEAEFPCNVILI